MPILSKNKRKRQQKLSSLQEAILCTIPKLDYSSKSTVSKQLRKHYADVSKAMDILLEKGLIIQHGENKGVGKIEKYYIPSEKGIKKIIETNISLEEFWELMFFVFDDESKSKLVKLSANDFFEIYENNVLHLPEEQGTKLFDMITDNISKFRKYKTYDFIIDVLWVIAENKTTTLNQLLKKMGIPKNSVGIYYSKEDNSSLILNKMSSMLLIRKNNNSSVVRFSLSHFGMLVLLDWIYYSKIEKKSSHDLISDKINLLINNQANLFPHIFQNWKILRKIFKDIRLVTVFQFIFRFDEVMITSDSIQIGGLYEIFRVIKTRREIYRNIRDNEYDTGITVLDKWAPKNTEMSSMKILEGLMYRRFDKKAAASKGPLQVLDKISDLLMETSFYGIDGQDNLSHESFKMDYIYNQKETIKKFEKMIAFQFYTILRQQVRMQVNLLEFIVLNSKQKDQKIQQEITHIKETWKVFLKRNPNLEKNYKKWIKDIADFERKNSAILNNMDNLTLDSLEMQRRFDMKIMRKIKKGLVNNRV
jgi:hypothetical protein